jgi:signal transduction histidine kinase
VTSTDTLTQLGEKDLRACIRDLVALSAMPTWWIGRSPAAIAESVRDLLVSMLRAEAAYVQVREPITHQTRVTVIGTSQGEVETALAEPRHTGDDRRLRFASFPIALNGELGRLAAGSSRPEFPNHIETLLLQVTANQVAVVLRHTALLMRHQGGEQLLAGYVAQQAAVADLGLRALGGIDIDLVLDEATHVVCDTLGADLSEVLELSEDAESLLLRAGVGWHPGLVGGARVSAGRDSQGGYTLAMSEPVIVDDLGSETRFAVPQILTEHGTVSGITVIIHHHHRPFGVLGVHTREPRRFTLQDVNFMQSVANLLAAALQHHQVQTEREELLHQLQQAVAARDRAVGIVSHDLGNPLSTIQICATALLDPDPPSATGTRHMAEIIQRSATWMQQILHDLLDRASLDSGRLVLDRQTTPLPRLLDAAQLMFAPVAQEHGVSFTVESGAGLPAVDADPARLLQVLSNLLGNAMKFTPTGGRVVLSVSADEDVFTAVGAPSLRSPSVRFAVSDDGPGITPEDLSHIFDWFWQSKPEGRSGTGLGLAIAKGLIEAHRGRLRVESTPGKGSTFWFALPVAGPD